MHKTGRLGKRQELVFFEEGNSHSLVSMLPEGFAYHVKVFCKSEYFKMLSLGEASLRSTLSEFGFIPCSMDLSLRYNFWQEYDAAQAMPRNVQPFMNMSKVLRKAIAKENFYQNYITDYKRLAFLLSPPPEAKHVQEKVYFESASKLSEFIAYLRPGPVDPLLMNAIQQLQKINERSSKMLMMFYGLDEKQFTKEPFKDPPLVEESEVEVVSLDEELNEAGGQGE